MKKTISYLGMALALAANVSMANELKENNFLNSSSTEIVKVDVNPLCVAISKGDIALVKTLIGYGANVNEKNERGMTPLMYAVMYNEVDILKLLLDNGAKTSARDNNGNSALDFAKTDEVKNLLKQKPNKK